MTTTHDSMSTTMTITMSQTCPNCGFVLPEHIDHSAIAEDAQKMIRDLQAQVRLLSQKATAAGKLLPPIIMDVKLMSV